MSDGSPAPSPDQDVPLPVDVAQELQEPTERLRTVTEELALIVLWLSSPNYGPVARREASARLYAKLHELVGAFEHFANVVEGIREAEAQETTEPGPPA